MSETIRLNNVTICFPHLFEKHAPPGTTRLKALDDSCDVEMPKNEAADMAILVIHQSDRKLSDTKRNTRANQRSLMSPSRPDSAKTSAAAVTSRARNSSSGSVSSLRVASGRTNLTITRVIGMGRQMADQG